MYLLSILLLPLVLLSLVRKQYFLNLESTKIYCMNIALDQSKCCFDWINGHARLRCPLISGTSRDDTNDFPSSFPSANHNSIAHMIYRSISAASADEIITLFSRSPYVSY